MNEERKKRNEKRIKEVEYKIENLMTGIGIDKELRKNEKIRNLGRDEREKKEETIL